MESVPRLTMCHKRVAHRGNLPRLVRLLAGMLLTTAKAYMTLTMKSSHYLTSLKL